MLPVSEVIYKIQLNSIIWYLRYDVLNFVVSGRRNNARVDHSLCWKALQSVRAILVRAVTFHFTFSEPIATA